MKVFVSADIEGIAGVTSWDETLPGRLGYEEAQIQMNKEVTAACDAAIELGYEVVVKDGHDAGLNLHHDKLPKNVELIRGWMTTPECNDGRLNDIRGLHIEEKHIIEAIVDAGTKFAEGAVGAGTGMCCLGLKGGIGSASRIIKADGKKYTVGALVMSNFGGAGNLVIGGKHYDTKEVGKDQGSIIILIATDLPLSERQLNRVSKRATIALARTGSYCGNGSGDIAIAFTTANRVPHYSKRKILEYKMFDDDSIDLVFESTVEAVEEAVISSLWHADSITGIRGKQAMGLQDFLKGSINEDDK